MKTISHMLVLFAVAGLMVASAASSYRVKLYQESHVGDTVLKPGEYKVTVDNGQVVLSGGNSKAEAKVAVESADAKYNSTSVRYQNGDGKYRVKEIRLGGTNTRLVFN